MKKMIGLSFLLSAIFFFSCNKGPVVSNQSTPRPPNPPNPPNPLAPNKSPTAIAGQDISVNYDLQTCRTNDTITLNGSTSFDPDGTIASYLWKGPGLIPIADSPTIRLKNLMPGSYKYVLLVTDDKGAIGTDTVTVSIVSLMNRGIINADLLPFGILSQPRANVVIASAGNKILFAGGYVFGGGSSTRVDIYDISTNNWSIAELSTARHSIATAVAGNKIFFAGGAEGGWWDGITTYSTVDIYDASANTWSVANLSESRGWITAASVSNKVFFAGGITNNYANSPTIDIYDVTAGSWSTVYLTTARSSLSAETVNNKIYFAGGLAGGYPYYNPSAVVDIYDNNTGSWSVSAMSEPKSYFQSIAIGNKIFWAGGSNNISQSNNVEIKDLNTQNSIFACLFQPMYADHGYQKAVSVNNKILFLPGNVQDEFDIYDMTTNTWFIGKLNKALYEAHAISADNTIYVAGGYVNGALSRQVWKLEF